MSRPTKVRRVCSYPENLSFSPATESNEEPIILTMDEYETVRLIDKEGLSQEECSVQLGVGRTTVQKIYETARKKLAQALVKGLPLKIQGGDYSLCTGNQEDCYRSECGKARIQREYYIEKGDAIMRIAVTYENGSVFQHFGHTEQFKIYDVTDGKTINTQIVDTNGTGHGALAGVLAAMNTDVLICGGIGGGAQMALSEAGIKLYGGVSGNADKAVAEFIAGKLNFDPAVHCDHHEHDETHKCSDHGCGKEGCGKH